MTEELADDGEAKARPRANRRKGVPEVVQANAFESGVPTHSRPGLLQIGPRLIQLVADDHERPNAAMRLQDLKGSAVQHDRLSACLRILLPLGRSAPRNL